MSSITLDRKFYVVAIKKMLNVSDFIEIAKEVHKGRKNSKIKFRFVEPKKPKPTITKKGCKAEGGTDSVKLLNKKNHVENSVKECIRRGTI